MNDIATSIRSIVSSLNIDPLTAVAFDEFSKKYNIRIKEGYIGIDTCGNEILGACKSEGLKKLVIASPNIQNPLRKRFTIAHEIGHLYLHHGNNTCIATDFDLWNDKQMREAEANVFAAEFLLPYTRCLDAIKKNDISFSVIDKISCQYEVSLYATAIRLVKIDTGMSVVIAHDGDKIQWVIKSPECRKDFTNTIINSHFLSQKSKGTTSTIKKFIDPIIWFDGDVDGWICEEETRYFKNLNSFLTIINIYEK